jgi:hypothetical protein
MRTFILRGIRRESQTEENESAFLSDPAEDLIGLDYVSHGKSAVEVDPQTAYQCNRCAQLRIRNNDNRGNNTNGAILSTQIPRER